VAKGWAFCDDRNAVDHALSRINAVVEGRKLGAEIGHGSHYQWLAS
jgi:hypothetical protein